MQLRRLASLLTVSRIEGSGLTEITGIQMDSRKAGSGDLFICVPGLNYDGHQYAAQAVEQGAAALVTERVLELDAPQLVVKDSRFAMAVIADHFYGHPSHHIKVIGVTGTNGKTTTTYVLEKILRDQGFRTGLMGTIETRIGSRVFASERTTQEAPDLQRHLQMMRDDGADYCVMEVSSHALERGRVHGCRFHTAVFTNLTQDHLDYHHTMERYKAAKGLLFARLGNEYPPDPSGRRHAVLNGDDPASADYGKLTAAQVITYGVEGDADVRASDIRITPKGTAFKLHTFVGDAEIGLPLIGKFNVYNALSAIATALVEGIPLDRIKSSLERVDIVPGRMEPVPSGRDFLVVVDYAHTPDGLENALTSIREFAAGRVITVFGCGGDRDRTKRPMMGRIAAQYSDYVIATSDNPRSEEPLAILRDVEPGILAAGLDSGRYRMTENRKEAIEQAVAMASANDVVLIAGKGHETYQLIQGVAHDFDDRRVAAEALRRLKP